MSVDVRDVLARVDLAELLTALTGEPVGHGATKRWHCPDSGHVDENPSVTMFVDRAGTERWRCWSGDHRGTAVDALMGARNIDFATAKQQLLDRSGQLTPSVERPAARQQHGPHGPSRSLTRWVAECEVRLWTPAGQDTLNYLRSRTLTDDVIRANRLGCTTGVDTPPGLPPVEGVVIASFDHRHELAYAQVRIPHATGNGKYRNPTSRHAALPAVTFPRGGPTSGRLLVCEGVLDGLAAISGGDRAVAIISAAHVTPDAATAIVHASKGERIVLALDADTAGEAAADRLADLLRAAGATDLSRLRLPAGHDITSIRQATVAGHTPTPPSREGLCPHNLTVPAARTAVFSR